jgi:hypothetical protein
MLPRQRKNQRTLFTARGLVDSEDARNRRHIQNIDHYAQRFNNDIAYDSGGKGRRKVKSLDVSHTSEPHISYTPTDDLSLDPTIYVASVDDEFDEAQHMGCMDGLLFPTKRDPKDSFLKFNKVGPSTTEVEFNMKLPNPMRFMKQLAPTESDMESAMGQMNCKGPKLDKKCDLNLVQPYRQFDDHVLEMNPGMHFHSAAVPPVFKSLMSLSEASSEEDSVHNGDNFQILGQPMFCRGHYNTEMEQRGATPLNLPRPQHSEEVPPIYSFPSQIFIQEQLIYGAESCLSFEVVPLGELNAGPNMNPNQAARYGEPNIDFAQLGKPMLSVDSEDSEPVLLTSSTLTNVPAELETAKDKENDVQADQLACDNDRAQVFDSQKLDRGFSDSLRHVNLTHRDRITSFDDGGQPVRKRDMKTYGHGKGRNAISPKAEVFSQSRRNHFADPVPEEDIPLKPSSTERIVNQHQHSTRVPEDNLSIGAGLIPSPWPPLESDSYDFDDQVYPSFDEGPIRKKATPDSKASKEENQNKTAGFVGSTANTVQAITYFPRNSNEQSNAQMTHESRLGHSSDVQDVSVSGIMSNPSSSDSCATDEAITAAKVAALPQQNENESSNNVQAMKEPEKNFKSTFEENIDSRETFADKKFESTPDIRPSSSPGVNQVRDEGVGATTEAKTIFADVSDVINSQARDHTGKKQAMWRIEDLVRAQTQSPVSVNDNQNARNESKKAIDLNRRSKDRNKEAKHKEVKLPPYHSRLSDNHHSDKEQNQPKIWHEENKPPTSKTVAGGRVARSITNTTGKLRSPPTISNRDEATLSARNHCPSFDEQTQFFEAQMM